MTNNPTALKMWKLYSQINTILKAMLFRRKHVRMTYEEWARRQTWVRRSTND